MISEKKLDKVCSPPFKRGGDPNFENFKKEGDLKKIWELEIPKGGIFKIKGGTQLFKLNLGIKRIKRGLSETN